MVKNCTCEKCGKVFSQKGHYTNHLNRKTPCKPIENKLIEEKVEEKLQELYKNGDITINNLNLNLNYNEININNMDNQSNEVNNLPQEVNLNIQNKEGLVYLNTINNNSIDLILTDPPYITSTETGMGNLYKQIKENNENGIKFVKTEEEWDKVKDKYIGKKKMEIEIMKQNYMKFGSIYGSKYSVQTEYGDWDSKFTMDILDKFIGEYYKKLKKGGTCIIFFDIWKITSLKELMDKHKFKQIRFIEWIKTNPQPLNSKTNYLTNCREIALLGVKGGKPTFNSKYDNAIYQFPLQGGKNRFHPTQKSLLLFEELIKKHSNEGDTVLDTFLGSGTTVIACKKNNRICKGCEVSKEYYDKMIQLL
tara:strand:- start:102 stop:1190 length:1089 start_codon:yes stop_codon:yes gene_type:complete